MTATAPIFLDPYSSIGERYLPDADKRLAGTPWQALTNAYSSPCGRFHSGIWEAEPGHWRVHYTEFEYCEILAGESLLHGDDGRRIPLRCGDRFVIPAGFRGSWEVVERCRKVYVIYEPADAAQPSPQG